MKKYTVEVTQAEMVKGTPHSSYQALAAIISERLQDPQAPRLLTDWDGYLKQLTKTYRIELYITVLNTYIYTFTRKETS